MMNETPWEVGIHNRAIATPGWSSNLPIPERQSSKPFRNLQQETLLERQKPLLSFRLSCSRKICLTKKAPGVRVLERWSFTEIHNIPVRWWIAPTSQPTQSFKTVTTKSAKEALQVAESGQTNKRVKLP